MACSRNSRSVRSALVLCLACCQYVNVLTMKPKAIRPTRHFVLCFLSHGSRVTRTPKSDSRVGKTTTAQSRTGFSDMVNIVVCVLLPSGAKIEHVTEQRPTIVFS